MTEPHPDYTMIIMLIGGVVVLTIAIKAWFGKIGIPELVGFILLGFFIRLMNMDFLESGQGGREIIDTFSKIGLITLLFKVGLESNIHGLLKQLRSASLVWTGDVLVSGLFGFATAYYILGLQMITSIIIATAFTATSVGISVAVWESSNALNSKNGELLIDIAELDDISAVVIMALLFALLPIFKEGIDATIWPVILRSAGGFLLKLVGFGLFCAVFSKFVEKRITACFKGGESESGLILVVVGIGFIIAAFAEWIGFSFAIGAFFAGLVFSLDEVAVKNEGSFIPLYELFSPFFFIGIGMQVAPDALGSSVYLFVILAAAAIASKIVADGVPVWMMGSFQSAALIGISMVPRAEIAMVIMQHGLDRGSWAVSPEIFNAMVLVSIITCTVSPVFVQQMLRKWPQTESDQ